MRLIAFSRLNLIRGFISIKHGLLFDETLRLFALEKHIPIRSVRGVLMIQGLSAGWLKMHANVFHQPVSKT